MLLMIRASMKQATKQHQCRRNKDDAHDECQHWEHHRVQGTPQHRREPAEKRVKWTRKITYHDREENGRNLDDAIAVRGTCPNVRLRGLWPRRNSKKQSVLGSSPTKQARKTETRTGREGPEQQAKSKTTTRAAGRSKSETEDMDQDPDGKPRERHGDVSLLGCWFSGLRPLFGVGG